MNSKIVLLAILIMSQCINVSAQQNNESLDRLILLALRVSPKVKLLKLKRGIANSKIQQETNLPDPMITLGLVNMPTNSFSFTQEPMTGKIVGITQAFPFPGGLGAKANVIAIDTLIVDQEIDDYKNEVRKDVSILYYDLQLAREELKLTNESKSLLEQISEVVKTRYEVSEVSLQNLIQVEVELTRTQDKIESLVSKEIGIVAELNSFLLKEDNSQIKTENIFPIKNSNYNSKELIKAANDFRPFLKGIKFSSQKARLAKKSAEYLFYPNFQLGLQYTTREYSFASGQNWNNLFSVVVGVSVPLNYGGKYSSKIEEAMYLQNFYREQYNYSIQSLNKSFGKIVAKLNELQNRDKLISGTLLNQAELALHASLSEYQVGKIDLVNVITAEKDILKIKTDLAIIRTEYSKNIAQLNFLVGTKNNGELK